MVLSLNLPQFGAIVLVEHSGLDDMRWIVRRQQKKHDNQTTRQSVEGMERIEGCLGGRGVGSFL